MKKTPTEILPAISLRGLVVFPSMVLHFDVGRERSVKALNAAANGNSRIFLVTQKDASLTDPDTSDIYEIGVIAEVRQILTTPDGSTRVLVEGLARAKRLREVNGADYLQFEVKEIPRRSPTLSESTQQAAVRSLKSTFAEYSQISPRMPRELFEGIMSEENLSELFEKVVFNVVLRVEDKQALLEENGLLHRVMMLIAMLENEIEIIETEIDIQEQVKEQVDKNQRDYYLREQIRAIYKQLGEGENPQEESEKYIERIQALNLSDEITEKLVGEAEKLVKMSYSSQEAGVIRSYLDTVLELPWNVYTKDKLDIAKVEKQLDKDHYGLKKVKERITEIISVRALAPDVKGQIICLYGPPGVGKTSIGRSIAEALGRKYVRISLGGVHDEAEIRGHRKTYIGAMPGRIAAALKQAKSMNPVMLLDEIDKMGSDYKGDPASAMLEVLDSEQNTSFTDHYLEIPLDLSNVLFITTANSLDTIPAPLLDRMEVIELSSYTREEKFNIAKKHLLPKQLKKHGEKPSTVKINDKALYSVIDFYTREAGVRKLERSIADICRKSAKKLVSGEKKVSVTDQNITDFLGVKKYLPEHLAAHDEIGLVNGLAWTSVGGVTMPLEVLVLDGTGKTEFTGSLGEVMKESAKIAVSLTRSLAKKYNIDPDFYKNKDIHVHAPEGAVPKDGPSAGVTLTTALVSALSGTPVRRDVAMTGEITLRGKVLAIGGLKEKTMAAYRAGVKTVCIPKENEPDIDELDEVVKNSLKFVVAEDISTVLETALVLPNVASEKKPLKRRTSAKSKPEESEKIPALTVN
ncbi:MAG: endopeptidase La [Oscillospiraceae bacterium]